MLYQQNLALWHNSQAFRSFYISVLNSCPISRYGWELPPLSMPSLSRPTEFILVPRPGLSDHADPGPFQAYFSGSDPQTPVVSFPNLGGDALLIVPTPQGPLDAYAHLGEFLRKAPSAQRQALFQITAQLVENNIADQPVWLNSAGGGVDWLHIRIDTHPKYILHPPYKKGPSEF